MKIGSLFPYALVAGLLFLGSPVRATNEPKDKTPWKITGQLEEACSCDAACPCWFGSKPTKMTCGGGQVLFIQKGNYGKVRLDGLAIASMAQSPEGQSMMESFGNWNFAYNYIDEKATPEQRKALEAITAADFSRAFDRWRSGRFAENCESTGRRSDSSRIRPGTDLQDDI